MHSTTKGALNKMRAGLKGSRRAGMSLIEVVLAIAVAGFVLTAATSFVVSVSSIWSTRAERHFFEDHVDGVMQFLQSSFDRAGIAIATERGEDSQNNPEENTEEAPAPSQKAPQVELETEVGSETNGEKNGASNNGEEKGVSLIQGSEEPISWERLPGASNYEDP
ncbi:MAG: PilW family protein, partial [Opitutales bacterium]